MSSNTEPLSASPELPSLKEMAFNLVGTAKDMFQMAVARGQVLAPDDTVKARWDMCWSCEFFLKETILKGIKRECVCSKCGCAMRSKVRFAAVNCPVGKW
jgi:hypothetical protein